MSTKKTISLPYISLTALLQTAISITPGILSNPKALPPNNFLRSMLLPLVLYLFFNHFFILFTRKAHQDNKKIATQAYIVKLLVSLALLGWTAFNSTIQIAIILLAYELFIFLNFSSQFNYQASILHTLINSLFNGIIFNLLITFTPPYTFKQTDILPFLFSFTLLILQTIYTQTNFATKQTLTKFRLLEIITLLILVFGMIKFAKTQMLATKMLTLLLSLLGITTFIHWFDRHLYRNDFLISVLFLSMLIVFYY